MPISRTLAQLPHLHSLSVCVCVCVCVCVLSCSVVFNPEQVINMDYCISVSSLRSSYRANILECYFALKHTLHFFMAFKYLWFSGQNIFKIPVRKKKKMEVVFSSVQFSSVTQSCPTLCDPMEYSTPGLPAHHQLPEFTQTHVH